PTSRRRRAPECESWLLRRSQLAASSASNPQLSPTVRHEAVPVSDRVMIQRLVDLELPRALPRQAVVPQVQVLQPHIAAGIDRDIYGEIRQPFVLRGEVFGDRQSQAL